jgi:hypothetical protein
MVTQELTFAQWLEDSAVSTTALTAPQRTVLRSAFRFLQNRGRDYFSRRLLSHFLLHAGTGLKVAQIARLLDFSRSAASAQQGLASKEVVQAAHHRLAGRSHGKLLPRFAGPIAHFLHDQPKATRWDVLDFIQQTWGVSVSRVALHRFLKKYGLDGKERAVPPPQAAATTPAASNPAASARRPAPPPAAAHADGPPLPSVPVPRPPQDFFLPRRSTPVPFCCCPPP